MDESDITKHLEKICSEYRGKSYFTELLLKSDLFQKIPKYKQNFNFIVFVFHNKLEDIFDRILRSYTRPKQKDEWIFSDEIMSALKIKSTPEDIRQKLIFKLGFNDKKKIIYDLFPLSKDAKNVIDRLNIVRNSIAHRCNEDDESFKYIKKNVLTNSAGMASFLMHCNTAIGEVLSWETQLLDAIDKAEKELN